MQKQNEMFSLAKNKIDNYLSQSVIAYQEWFEDIEIYDKIKDGVLAIDHKFN